MSEAAAENKAEDKILESTENGTTNGHHEEASKEVESSDKTEEKTEATETTTAEEKTDAKPEETAKTSEDKPQQETRRPTTSSRTFRDRQARSTFDLPESRDPDEIRAQVEFYFGDSNLPIDAHMLKLTGGHANNPVPLKEIHNFKRMRHFQPFSAVREAVQASSLLSLDSDDQITRKIALDEKFTTDIEENRKLVHSADMARSIYAKGFGDEMTSTHTDIEAFFAPYGPIRAVRLRRNDIGNFKGSVFVEFDSEEGQKKFLELETKPEWDGKELQIMSKKEYVDTKHQGILDGIVKPNGRERGRGGRNDRGGGRGRGRGRGRGGRGGGRDRRDRDRDDGDRRDNKRAREDDGGDAKEAKKVKEDASAE